MSTIVRNCRIVLWAVIGIVVPILTFSLELGSSAAIAQVQDPDCYVALGVARDPAPVKCCVREATIGLMHMRRYAQSCGARAQDLDSIDAGNAPLISGDCERPLNVMSQLDAFTECARVYLCAKKSLQCVRDKAKSTGVCRAQYAHDCLARFPVPAG